MLTILALNLQLLRPKSSVLKFLNNYFTYDRGPDKLDIYNYLTAKNVNKGGHIRTKTCWILFSLLHRMTKYQRVYALKLQPHRTLFPTRDFLFLRRYQPNTENLPISVLSHFLQLFIYSPLYRILGSKTITFPGVLRIENITVSLHKSNFWDGIFQKRIKQVLVLPSNGGRMIRCLQSPGSEAQCMGSNPDPTPTSYATLVKLLNLCTLTFFHV